MKALVFATEDAPGAGALDLAGRPLLVRQLQWLRDLGIEEVAIEIVDGPHADACAALVLGSDPLTARCTVIPTARAIGAAALAERAGLAPDELFLALPGPVVAQATLTLPDACCSVELEAPPFALDERRIVLAFRTLSEVASESEPHPGWAVYVPDATSAHTLSCAAVAGQAEGLLIHGAEVRPGIWYARGARVAEDATLVPPVVIGPEARVFARARLGPNVIVGRRAVVEREAVLSEVSVAPATLVGEGARVRQAHVDASGFTSFADGVRTEVRDPLLVTSTALGNTSLAARGLAVLWLLIWMLPWCAAAALTLLFGRRPVRGQCWREQRLLEGTTGLGWVDVAPRLLDVALGRRDLVGVPPPVLDLHPDGPAGMRPGALNVSAALGSGHVLPSMLAWYRLNKSPGVDTALLCDALRRR